MSRFFLIWVLSARFKRCIQYNNVLQFLNVTWLQCIKVKRRRSFRWISKVPYSGGIVQIKWPSSSPRGDYEALWRKPWSWRGTFSMCAMYFTYYLPLKGVWPLIWINLNTRHQICSVHSLIEICPVVLKNNLLNSSIFFHSFTVKDVVVNL